MLANLRIQVPRIQFSRFSLEFNFRQMTLLPCLMMLPLCIFSCLSFSDNGFETLSLGIYAIHLLVFVSMSFFYFRELKMSHYDLHFTTYMLTLIGLTIMFNGDIKGSIYIITELMTILMFFSYFKDRLHIVIIGLTFGISLCVYLGFWHFLAHPELWIVDNDQSSNGYLLGGNYNGMGVRMLLALIFSMICIKYSKLWTINFIGLIIASYIPLLITGSKTSTLGITLFLTGCFIPTLKLKKVFLYVSLIFFILFQCFIVFSGKSIEQNELAVYIIEDILKKDITFTFRTYLWDQAMSTIAESPLLGYGYVGMEWYKSHITISVGTGPHNMFLSILVNGGVALLAFYIYLACISFRKSSVCNDCYSWNIRLAIIYMSIILLLEYQSYFFPMTLFVLAYFYPDVKKETIKAYDKKNYKTHYSCLSAKPL